MKITVRAKPNAREEKVVRIDDKHFEVSVKAPAKEGKANKAIELALAAYFKVRSYEVEIVSGHLGKLKVVEVMV